MLRKEESPALVESFFLYCRLSRWSAEYGGSTERSEHAWHAQEDLVKRVFVVLSGGGDEGKGGGGRKWPHEYHNMSCLACGGGKWRQQGCCAVC